MALLCAVANRPELLLLDEPAGGLDPAARREFPETSIQLRGPQFLRSELPTSPIQCALVDWGRGD